MCGSGDGDAGGGSGGGVGGDIEVNGGLVVVAVERMLVAALVVVVGDNVK